MNLEECGNTGEYWWNLEMYLTYSHIEVIQCYIFQIHLNIQDTSLIMVFNITQYSESNIFHFTITIPI